MAHLIDLLFKFFENLMSSLEDTIDNAMKNRGRVSRSILSFFRTILTNIHKASTSLSVTVVVLILILVFVPLVLMGTTNYLRSRSLLEKQFSLELSNISAYQSGQLEGDTQKAGEILGNLATQPILNTNLQVILNPKTSPTNLNLAYFQLESTLASFRTPIQLGGEKVFDQIFIIQADGKVIDSSDASLKNQNLGKVAGISEIIGKKQSIAVFNPSPLYLNNLVIFSAYPLPVFPGSTQLTIMGASLTSQPLNDLTGAEFFSSLPMLTC